MKKAMTSKEVEQKIFKHMQQIRKLHNALGPEDGYLTLCIHHNGEISFNNTYWELPEDKQINFYEDIDESGEALE